jgi:hypothetical protein
MHRKLVILVGSALFASTALVGLLATAANAAVQDNERIPFNQQVAIPCANGGTGDIVTLSGSLHLLATFTLNENHISGVVHFQPQGVVGTDTEGHVYHAVGKTQDTFSATITGVFVETFVNNFYLVGTAGAPTLKVHDTIHTTINANGIVTASVDNSFITCG